MDAICHVSLAPIRSEAKDSAEMISQLLFGETVEILVRKKKWVRVKCHYDGYIGWVDPKQLLNIKANIESEHLCFRALEHYEVDHQNHPIVLGSNLPNFDGLQFKVDKRAFRYTGKSITVGPQNKAHLKKIALKYLNAPYLWGGRSPFGIDCSGLTQLVYKFLKVQLPRDAYQQAECGMTINFVEESAIGDLAFFGPEERITHVGLILENQQILHASGQVRIDTLDHFGIFNAQTKGYSHKLKVIKRIID